MTTAVVHAIFSIILIVAWQWLPFATLILLTALQSLEQYRDYLTPTAANAH